MAWEEIYPEWRRVDEQREAEYVQYELNGKASGRSAGMNIDLAAEVTCIGNNHWRIRTWSGPAVGATGMTEMNFDGSLEEAQAVAIVQVRL